MKRHVVSALASSGLVLVMLTGCSVSSFTVAPWVIAGIGGVAAGGGAAALYKSGAEDVLGAGLADVCKAAGTVLEEIGDGVVDEDSGSTSATLRSRFKDTAKITVKLKSVSTTATKVKVWVGITGDKERSRMVIDDIVKKLESLDEGKSAAVPAPKNR